MNSRIHPTALRLREAISVPTVAYPMPATAMKTLNTRSAPLMVVAPALIHTSREANAAETALRAHVDQASPDAVRSFIRRIVRRGPGRGKGVARTSTFGFPLQRGCLPLLRVDFLRQRPGDSEGPAPRRGGPFNFGSPSGA